MEINTYDDIDSIDYVFVEHHDETERTILVSLFGEGSISVKFNLDDIEWKPDDFQITGNVKYLDRQIRIAQGEKVERKQPPEMIKLVEPSWVNPQRTSFGYDVLVYRKGAEEFGRKTRIFFGDWQVKDGYSSLKVVKKKEAEKIAAVNVNSKIPNSEFIVSGLRAKETKSGSSGRKLGSRKSALQFQK